MMRGSSAKRRQIALIHRKARPRGAVPKTPRRTFAEMRGHRPEQTGEGAEEPSSARFVSA
jgi:hypothetical protein